MVDITPSNGAYTIFFDGACEPVNPGGVATWGFVVYKDNNLIHADCGIAGTPFSINSTNNFAEYTALIKALEYCLKKDIEREGIERKSIERENIKKGIKEESIEKGIKKDIKHLLVKGDSQLVIKQITGGYSVRSACILPLYMKASVYARKFETIVFKWVPREENKEADRLSKKAYTDYVSSINPDSIVLPFGRFKGHTIFWLKKYRPRYVEWLANQTWLSPELKEILNSVER